MIEMAEFICSRHAEGPVIAKVSVNLASLGKPIPQCPECGLPMVFNGVQKFEAV